MTLEELYAFIGLMYYRGLMEVNKTNLDRLFGGKDNVPMFGATMTLIRLLYFRELEMNFYLRFPSQLHSLE